MTLSRAALKGAILDRLDSLGREHPLGHQGAYANRYTLRSDHGAPIEVMFEKGEKSPANLWVRADQAGALQGGPIPLRHSPAATLYQKPSKDGGRSYGRHSALEPMPLLGQADLLCVALRSVNDLVAVIAILLKVQQTGKIGA